MADKLSNLPKNQRLNSATVIRTKSGKYIVSTNKTKNLNTEVSKVLDDLGNVNNFNRGYGEVSAISRGFDKGSQSELAGADIYTAYVRGPNSTTELNGAYHSPCDVCGPLLDFFKMNQIEW